jgi:hypothetical protein
VTSNPASKLKHRLVGCSLVAILGSWAAVARADDMAGAANAYSKAQRAELSGDSATAAELFELADSLAPSPEALRSAIRARVAAGHLGVAAVHSEALLERYPEDERSAGLAKKMLEEARRTMTRVSVKCAPGPCGIELDGAAGAVEPKQNHALYLEPGDHELQAVFGGERTKPQKLSGVAGDDVTLEFAAPPKSRAAGGQRTASRNTANTPGAEAAPAPVVGGLSPWFFATGAVVTAGLGAATIWSGVDVARAHSAYEGYETRESYEQGLSKERRTNTLIGLTAGAGAVTIALALLTDWKGEKPEAANAGSVRVGAHVAKDSMAVSFGGRY